MVINIIIKNTLAREWLRLMVYFGEGGLIANQFIDHYGMTEIYSHLFALTFFFNVVDVRLRKFYKLPTLRETGTNSYFPEKEDD